MQDQSHSQSSGVKFDLSFEVTSDYSGFERRSGEGIFFSPPPFTPALQPTHTPSKWTPGTFPGGKAPMHGTEHPP